MGRLPWVPPWQWDYDPERKAREAAELPWVPPLTSMYWRQSEMWIDSTMTLETAIAKTQERIDELEMSLTSNPKLMTTHPEVKQDTREFIVKHQDNIKYYRVQQNKGHLYVGMPNDWTPEQYRNYMKARHGKLWGTTFPPSAPYRESDYQKWDEERKELEKVVLT